MHACLIVCAALGASTPTPATEVSSNDLDHDLAAVSASLREEAGIHVGATMRFNYSSSSDIQIGGKDLGGFTWDNLRLEFDGRFGDFDVHLGTESAAVGQLVTPLMQDAFVRTQVCEGARMTVGKFRSPFLEAALYDPQDLLFILRTVDGQIWYDNRDEGVMFDGSWEHVHWALAAQNGFAQVGGSNVSNPGDDLAFTARVAVDVLGDGACHEHEGALGAREELGLTVGVGYHDDAGGPGDSNALALEAHSTWKRFGASLEWLDYGDNGGGATNIYAPRNDQSPLAFMLSYMAIEDRCEVGVRYEDDDDTDNTERWTVGANWYFAGHDAKAQLNYYDEDSDVDDLQAIGLGITLHI